MDDRLIMADDTESLVGELLLTTGTVALDVDLLKDAAALYLHRIAKVKHEENLPDRLIAGGILYLIRDEAPREAVVMFAGLHEKLRDPKLFDSLISNLIFFFDSTSAVVPLMVAIGLLQTDTKNRDDADPLLASRLDTLVVALRRKSSVTRNPIDIDAVILKSRAGIKVADRNCSSAVAPMAALMEALTVKYYLLERPEDISEAVNLARRLAALPGSDQEEMRFLHNAALALKGSFQLTGEDGDLQDAIEIMSRVEAASSSGGSFYGGVCRNLGNMLRIRFERHAKLADIDLSIAYLRTASSNNPPQYLAGTLSDLGSSLRTRFMEYGAEADLEAAAHFGERAVATPAPSAERPGLSNNLAYTLLQRVWRGSGSGDLDAAVALCEEAVRETPYAAVNWRIFAGNLAIALKARFARDRNGSDLDRSVALRRRAASAPNSADLARDLAEFASVLLLRFAFRGDTQDLAAAITAGRQAVLQTHSAHSTSAHRTAILANALIARYELTHAKEDRTAAAALLRTGAASISAPVTDRVYSALTWAHLEVSEERWGSATDAYAVAVELASQLAPRALHRADQEQRLAQLSGLASQAAACAIEAGRIEDAVLLWERGRTVLFTQTLELRTGLSDTSSIAPDLLNRFVQLRDLLDRPDVYSSNSAVGGDTSLSEQRRRTATELAAVVAQIRAASQPDFLESPGIDKLLEAASEGPIVLLNVSDIRSDGIILSLDGVRIVPLPSLHPAWVEERLVELGQVASLLEHPDQASPGLGEGMLTRLLADLWHTAAGPVLNALTANDFVGHENRRRLWWSPSGLLSFLPLHASGVGGREDGPPDGVLDRVVSSYTPSIRALIHARRGEAVASADNGPLLLVAMPTTPDEASLSGTLEEARVLREVLGKPRVKELIGKHATYASVASAIVNYASVHFACHGVSDILDSSRSRLLLHDHAAKPFTVLHIAALAVERPNFAFLSACSTAVPSVRLPDEALHIVASFHLAGYRHVAGTLWPIDDEIAADFTRHVYSSRDGLTDPAIAIHEAIRELRSAWPHEPSLWAGYIHSG